jgi:hypothetical protein
MALDTTNVCPYNHSTSKVFNADQAYHLRVCKCPCDWCERQFGKRQPGLNLGAEESDGKLEIADLKVRYNPVVGRKLSQGTHDPVL